MAKRKDGRGRPRKPDHVRQNIMVHGAVLEKARDLAQQENRPLSAQIEVLLREAFDARGVDFSAP